MLTANIPILPPGVLILTKLKRCVYFIGSTRPSSVMRFHMDELDIKYLLKWLAECDETVDFKGYFSPDVNELYSATKKVLKHWEGVGQDEWVRLMYAVMNQEDRDRMLGD
ncbi:hypothetical protein SODALDRAFT_268061 [Sodiomyces alkalinus F11]|uniref:Uncharacterized protein n=1 Tax=Sodiomyces alkalinus (strain CBS 110278 / VKM F-3762 / F11) TaxID=1314773 RepID=A0A3N2QAB1_SODAK|nr:hypothetical protein SODALDRAFT_268061 [Sodiomyces alkalinus F11]ROT43689.1 hypothetical protein SODALDRAFT_268061 [Sodiomyces alkalinus F11]